MENKTNKRKFIRIRTSKLQVEYNRICDKNKTNVDVVNISLGGLCFLTKSVLHKEDIIFMTFPFKSRTITLKSIVMWVQGKEVGIQFLEDNYKISEFMNTFNREYPEMENKFPRSRYMLFDPYNFIQYSNGKPRSGIYDLSSLDDFI